MLLPRPASACKSGVTLTGPTLSMEDQWSIRLSVSPADLLPQRVQDAGQLGASGWGGEGRVGNHIGNSTLILAVVRFGIRRQASLYPTALYPPYLQ